MRLLSFGRPKKRVCHGFSETYRRCVRRLCTRLIDHTLRVSAGASAVIAEGRRGTERGVGQLASIHGGRQLAYIYRDAARVDNRAAARLAAALAAAYGGR